VVLLSVSLRDTLWLLANSRTVLPTWRPSLKVSPPPAVQQFTRVYAHAAGIDRGYGYFAPNVPSSYHLALELELPDGSFEEIVPTFDSGEGKLRWASALDYIGRTSSEEVREVLLKLIVYSIHQHRPEGVRMLATLSEVRPPSLTEFQRGQRPRPVPLVSYRFRFNEAP
jgi:hypothetical protein